MAEFLTTNGTSYHIENIIIEAKHKLTLVSPYLQLSKTFYERLKDATNKGVKIQIIYGKDELKPNERNSLAELKNIELFYFENLHAKCYYNESKMVITSMNMYAFSEKNNREMGVLIDRNNDKELFEKAVNETLSILQSSEQEELKRASRAVFQTNSSSTNIQANNKQSIRGYCIRCENRIDYDVSKPFCIDCYTSWSKYENWSYEENVCHRCGEYETTTMLKPQCYNCYNISEYEKDVIINNKGLKNGNVMELHSGFSEPHNFHLPALEVSLKKMYPKIRIKLDDLITMYDFPIKGMEVSIAGRIDFIFNDASKYDFVKAKAQNAIKNKIPEFRFYWNKNQINIYPEKGFEPIISNTGLAAMVNKFVYVIKNTVEVIQAN
jgi:hypothetical protein